MPTRVSVAPFVPPAVHTAGVVEVKLTASADDAVAATTNGGCAAVRSIRAAKVIVWSTFETAKLASTGGAASYVAFPA